MKHSGTSPANCPFCLKAINAKGPDTPSAEFLSFAKAQRAKHFAALRRAERDDAMRSLGLKKVRGALGGTYWE